MGLVAGDWARRPTVTRGHGAMTRAVTARAATVAGVGPQPRRLP